MLFRGVYDEAEAPGYCAGLVAIEEGLFPIGMCCVALLLLLFIMMLLVTPPPRLDLCCPKLLLVRMKDIV